MKKIVCLIFGIIFIFILSCRQKKTDPVQTKSAVKVVSNQIVFDQLDIILSPFEDMTEFALNKNEKGILESMSKVENAQNNSIFEKNLTPGSMSLLNPKIEKLQELIRQKDYNQIALSSTEIFELNVRYFADGKKIEKQIQIEKLDYMGFKILALLNQDKVDWNVIEETISYAQKDWVALNPKIADDNLKDTVNYLFQSLFICCEQKDVKMCGVLANMNLSLVDVLEKSI